jgi:hypothetical protein
MKLFSTQVQFEHYLVRLLFRNDNPERLSHIFVHQQLYAIKSVRIKLEKASEQT